MRLISLALALGLVAAAATPEYRARRQTLARALPQAVLVFFGGTQTKDDLARFFPEPDFYYLTGWKQPHGVADTSAPLEAGEVLVTEQGARVLTAALPREAADIERALAK